MFNIIYLNQKPNQSHPNELGLTAADNAVGHPCRYGLFPLGFQLTVFCLPKGRLSRCNIWPFGVRLTAFRNVKDSLLYCVDYQTVMNRAKNWGLNGYEALVNGCRMGKRKSLSRTHGTEKGHDVFSIEKVFYFFASSGSIITLTLLPPPNITSLTNLATLSGVRALTMSLYFVTVSTPYSSMSLIAPTQ